METEPSIVSRNAQESSTASTPSAIDSVGANERQDNKEEFQNENHWEFSNAELRRLVDESRARADAHWNDLLRSRADVENIRRRAERDVENAHKFALERFSTELLPVKDSLELGLAATVSDAAKLREGMDLTLKMLTNAMAKFGIREVNPTNERFNPELHQAMTVRPNSTVPPNTVLAVYQKGYTLNERLIRPALVIVSRAPENGAAGEA
ncbi:Protein GrpE [Gammaproteobacteria bacterium]